MSGNKKWQDNIGHVPLNYNGSYCAKIRVGLDHADFKTKRQIIELLDIRSPIAFENEQKVLYLKCLIDPKERYVESGQKRGNVTITMLESSLT